MNVLAGPRLTGAEPWMPDGRVLRWCLEYAATSPDCAEALAAMPDDILALLMAPNAIATAAMVLIFACDPRIAAGESVTFPPGDVAVTVARFQFLIGVERSRRTAA